MPDLTVIYWRDIPAQVKASDGERTARAELDHRFQVAIDSAAMAAGLVESDAYLAEWRQATSACSPQLDDEVEQAVRQLDQDYPPERLRALAKAGGAEDDL